MLRLSIALGCDASDFDLDGPLPEIPETNASKSGRERFVTLAKRDNLTVRQLAQIAGSYGGLAFVGTPATIADQMEQWLFSEGCDGFNIMFPYVPGGLDDFVDSVVPELQRRGLFRARIRGQNVARESWAAAAGEPVLQFVKGAIRCRARSSRERVRQRGRMARTRPRRLGFFTRLLDQANAGERYRLATDQIVHAERHGFDQPGLLNIILMAMRADFPRHSCFSLMSRHARREFASARAS